jgi:SWI/SNF-related matrix-associated actin-dependent regulator 1 of chromatin subfamily A
MERYCDAKKFPKNGVEKEKRNRLSENFIKSKGKNNWHELTDEEKNVLNKIIERNIKMITVANGASNLEELKERVSHIYLRRVKEDIAENLPQKYIHELFYDFTDKQKQEYDKLWEEYENAQYENNPNKELNKELLEGLIYRRYCAMQMIPNTIKLVDKLINNGDKVIIATCFDDEVNMLKEYYGNKSVVYNGKMNSKEKDNAQKEFTDNPDILVFIGNIQAASVGLTLTASHKVVFQQISFVPGEIRQMEDRVYRIGQKHDVDIYYQFFRDTQYEKMWNLILKKEVIINSVIKKESDK